MKREGVGFWEMPKRTHEILGEYLMDYFQKNDLDLPLITEYIHSSILLQEFETRQKSIKKIESFFRNDL